MAERPLYTLYKNLKAQNYDVPDDYNKFESALTRDGKGGADNRHAIYENLKAQNFDVPSTYERFYSALFEPRSKTSSRAKGGSVPMSAADRARFSAGAAAISASAKQTMNNAGRYNRLKQRKQKQQKDFGRVNLGTHQTPYGGDANNVVKDDFAYNPETGKTGAYVTSDNENVYSLPEAEQSQAHDVAYQNAVDTGEIPSVLDVRDQNGNYDLQENINKNGTYLTEEGAQKQFDKKLEDAYARKKEIEAAIAEDHRLHGNPLLSYGASIGASNGRTAEQSDYSNKLATSLALVNEQIGALEAVKQYPTSSWGEDALKALDNTAFTAKTWDFGLTDFATMGQMERIKTKMNNNIPLSGSDKMLLKSKLGADAAAALEDEKMGNIYRWTKIAGQSLPFMADFFLTGGYGGITKGISSGALKFAAKRGMGKVSAAILKNTGIVAGDVIGSYAMAGTEQALKTGADIMQRHLGNLYQDEKGDYKFGTFDENGNLLHEGGESMGTALYKGLTSAMVENYTEKLFGHNYGIKKGAVNFMEKHGMNASAEFFKNIGKSGWYTNSKKWMEKFGVNGFAEEVMEEEIGIPLHALLDGEGKVSDLLDARQQLDIIGGMAISVGSMYAMGAGSRPVKGIYNRAQYYRFRNKVNVADSDAQNLFGDNWADIKDKIDNATNEQMGSVLADILRQRDTMTKEQINAAVNYGINLMKMRGYNIAKTAEMNAKEITNEPTTPEEQHQTDIDNAYSEGHDADDADKHDIQIQQEDKMKTLAAALGISEQQLSAMSDEELESLTGQDDKLDQAIYDYQLSSARYQGVVDDAQDKVDLAAHQAEQRVDMYTDQSRGSVRNATIKASGGLEDYGVYIISGNIATHDDGSIDVSNSDDMILYYDPTTNSVEHADALMFAELGEELPADDVKAQAVVDAKENAIKEVAGIIDGTVEVGSQFSVTSADGMEHTYEVLADYGDGTAAISIDGNVVENPYSFADLQQMKDLEDQKRLEAAKAEREQMEKERAAQQNQETEETQPSFDFNQILNDDGNVVLVDVLDKDGNTKYPDSRLFLIRDTGAKAKVVELKSDGTLVPHAVNKKDVSVITSMSLDEYKQAFAESSMIEDNSGENRGEIEVETPTIEGETAAPAEETAAPESAEETATEQIPAPEQSPAITLEDGTIVPMLEDGNPDFSKLTAAQTAELYDSQFGEDAESVISSWVSDAKKALDKANNMTVKGKTFVEQKAAKDAKEKAIADAQAAYDSAIAIRDAYNERQLAKVEDTAEGRKELIEKARRKFARLKSAVKDDAEAVAQIYKETVGTLLHRLYDSTGIDVTDTIPLTAEEYVASNLGAHSLNYEGTETSKGVKQETGLSREDFAKTQLLAADGKGTTIDNLVHSLWENRPSNLESLGTQDIRNALLSVITSGFKASEARNYIENLRIAQAENILEEQKKAADNAAFAEENKAESEQQAETAHESEEKTGEENSDEENEKINEQNKFPNKLKEGSETIEVPEDATDDVPLGAQREQTDLPFSARDNGTQQTTSERAADVEKNKVDDMKVVDNIVGEKTRKAFERLAKMMGANIQWQYSDKLGNGWIQETTDADGNVHRTIFITLDSSITEGAQFIFGHEMTHQIKNLNPAAYNELTQLVLDTYGSDAFDKAVDETMQRYSDAGFSGRARDYYAEEVVADAVGEMIRDLNLAHTLAMKMSHPLLAAIHEILQKIKLAFFGTEYSDVTKNIIRSIEQAYVKTANMEAANAATQEGESGQRLSLRTKPEPKKTQKVYKLMRLGEDGKLYPLFIGSGEAIELGKWYDADSPKLQDLTSLSSKDYVGTRTAKKDGASVKEEYHYGAYIVNNKTGEAMSLADFKAKYSKQFARMGNNPNKKAVDWATDNGYRWIKIEEKNQGQSRYGGEARSYYNYGINGSGSVSIFAMRPGWHAGSLPTMRQIGKGSAKNLRDDTFVWVEGEIPAEIDYNEEAQKNADKDIPDHIPTDGYYLKATNANKEASQADKVGWYVAGAFKANRIMSDKETRDIIDEWNAAHPDDNVEYDWKRESGKDFNAETMSLEDTPKFSLKVYHGSGADFTEFDFDHMGEGAGSQVFGWGGYVTSSKKIGKDYAAVGQQSAESRHAYSEDTPIEAAVSAILGQDMYNNQAKTFEQKKAQAIKNAENSIVNFSNMLNNSNELDEKSKKFLKESIEKDKKKLEVLRTLTEEQYKEEYIKQGRAKNLYEVDIPDDNGSNYLKWYETLSEEQINTIRDALAKKGVDVSSWEKRGFKLNLPFKDVYAAVLPMMMRCEPKDVSKFLSSLGYTGIKYPAGTIMGGAEEDDTNYVIFKPEDMRITEHTKFSIKTYHGSQASFDHFDHSFMGSGEGAQAYGWGTYVSEVEGIAKAYAKQNAAKHGMPREYKIAQIRLNHAKFEYDKVQRRYDNSKAYIDSLKEDLQNYRESIDRRKEKVAYFAQNNMPETVDKLLKQIKRTEDTIKVTENDINMRTNDLEGWKPKLEEVKKKYEEEQKKFDAIPKPQIERNLYSVDIPDDTGENYIGWDEKMTPRMRDIRKEILEDNGYKLVDSDEVRDYFEDRDGKEYELFKEQYKTGGTFYEELAQLLHSQKLASLALKEYGFDGVKVIAQRNTGGNKEGKMNYVIFDENNAQITSHTKFSLRLKSAIDETEINPSDAQKESGNYKKGHIKFGGYDYTIENPKGSTRSGKDADGKEWKVTMHDTYGYIRGKFGKDGDHLDMFINDKADLDNWDGDVFVVDQVNPDGSFDEHKLMYGYDSMDDAKKAYLANYSKGWKGLGNITGASKAEFDKWLDTSNRKLKPFADYAKVKFSQAQSVSEPRYSLKDEKTLAGVHNITEEKLLKAIKQGGLANPSVAVIDSSKQKHEDYGDISLILPSDKVAKRTGKNAGTWQGDAWTPTYPQVERQMSNKGAEKASKDVVSVPNDMYSEVRRGLDRWLDGGEPNSAMAYMFLHEKGVAPEPKKIQPKFSDEAYNELKSITAGDFNIYGIGKADAQKVLDMYIEAKFDGDKALYEEKTKAWLERNKAIVDAGTKGGMRYAIAKENVELYDEYGFNYKGVQTFVRDVEYDHRRTGVDMNATLNEVEDYIKTNNLTDEFNTWLEGKEKEYGIKEVIFDGFTPSGNRRYVPNTLENVSKIMKKQGRNGATGTSVSFQNFAAKLMPSYGTLKDIRSKKGLLTSDHEDLDKFNEKWANVFFELGMKCQPDATGTFDDYGLARLSEAAMTSDPQAYLKKEYNVDFSDEDTKRLKEMVKAIKEEYPAMYFETKFERPVGFDEFSSAVVPTTASNEVKQALQNAGVQIYEYDKEKEGDRSRAFNEAINSSDNIRFSLAGERGAAAADKAEERTARMDFLSVARKMEEEKKDAKTIKMATGWERGADGKWRYEMPDFNADKTITVDADIDISNVGSYSPYKEPLCTLSDLIDNKNLFAAYPSLKDIDILLVGNTDFEGMYDQLHNNIALRTDAVSIDRKFSQPSNAKEIEAALDKFNNFWKSLTGEDKELADDALDAYGGYTDEELNEDSDFIELEKENPKVAELVRLGNSIPSKKNVQLESTQVTLNHEGKIILVHEIQHAIQDIEGFAKGGSPATIKVEIKKRFDEVTKQIKQLRAEGKEDEAKALIEKNRSLYNAYTKNDDFNSYKSLAGEVEARNVSARLNMTPEERRKSLAESTEDVARKDQILLGVGDVSFSLRDMADGKESGAADMAEDLKSLNTPDEVDDAIKTAIDDMPSGWKMANKKMIHIAQALGENRKAEIAGEEPKFSLKDGSLIKAGTYFSGGGLVEEGLKGIIDPVVAVEYDEKISGVYRNNFGQHIVTADVRDVDPRELVKQIDGEVEYFHASPVCKNYSQAKSNHAEVELDKETAASTAEFINAIKPKVVTIENVKGYKDSEAMKTITDALDANGYTWDADVYNAADYGGYTNRERLIVRAVRDGKLPAKPKKMAHKSGWYEAVADIIPTLTEKKNGVAPWMDIRLKADGIDWRNIDKPLYVMGSAYADGKIPHAFADELLPTLRTKSGDVIVMPDGKVYRAMGRVLARVSGVSDDYKMPLSENLSHTIIGNGIPTQLTEHVIAPLLQNTLRPTTPEDGNTKFSLRYDKFEHDLNQWKKDNNLPKDAQRPTIPQRNAGESAVDFLRRVDEYRKQMALWKTAPTYEQHLLSDDTALGEFNRELQRGSVLKRIAFQDSMLAIRKAQEAIMKEVGVDRLNMAEDAYTAENRSHGKGKNEFEEYNNEFLQPLRKAYHQMKKILGNSYDNVRIYMMAKHGLERDAQMAFKKSLDADFEDVAQRSAAYRAYKGDMNRITNDSDLEFGRVDFNTWRQRDNALRTKYSPSYMDYRYDENGIAYDYSGLSALFGGSDFEEAAHKLVRDIESSHVAEVQDLWNATNAATKKILRDGYKAGMMSKDTYQYVRDMYSHYIPLRGWDGTTADQVWDYVGGGKGAFNQTLKTAHGRTSIANDPIAYIENMAESGILLNNKNWVKQHLMLLAQNHPTSLLTLSKAWYVKSTDANGNEEWIPATPQITSQMNSNQVKAAIDAFEQNMEKKAQTGDATQKRDGLNIAYPQTHSEEREHEVRVMKDGEEYVIYVNGDPQLAQAMNNTRAHRVREIQSGKLDRAAAWLGRKMAAAYTSLSPLFIPSNYFRDLTMTLASTAIREDAKYNYLLRKNLATSWNLGFMLRNYQNGKLREKVSNGNATPKEQMFYDFMMNGGETGFVSSLDVEDLKKKFKNDLKDLDRWKANPVKVWHTIMDGIEFLNRAIEDSNRFAVYMTSIQYGRSIDEAVNDAKDVTLNFNRKGTGEYGWQMIRNLYLFINPAVQSLQTLGALAKHHPFKFTAVTASWLVSGVLVPIVNAALMNLLGGDDDKDKYWQFTKWDRRNNLIMWVPFTNEYVKIPLAQEFRAFYGIGDMIASKVMGGELAEESWSQYAEDLLGQVVDMLPLDPTGYDGNIAVSLMPNAIRPVFELAFNVDFTGKPLFKDTEYNKYDPNFTKAYVGTPDWLVRASKMVNSIGNDYPDVQQNSIDAFGDPRYNLNNPAVVDHVLSSYLGGAYTMGSQVLGVLTKSLNDPKEIKVADIPLFSKFVSNPDDRPVTKKQGDEFWDMKENHDRAANTLSKLKKQAKVDGDYSLLERFYGSEEYKQYKQDDVKVKKYEEDKKKERAEESGEEYRPHKLNAEDIYKAHATPKDDFEDLKLKQLYTKLNGFKSAYDLLVDTAPSQSDGYYNTNKAAIDAIDEISLDKQEISELKKGFLDDGKDAYNAEDMKQIRELRKKILAVLEKANKVVVANQKAKAKK